MSWNGKETFRVCTSQKSYERWKKQMKEKQERLRPLTVEEAMKICHKYDDSEHITTDEGAFRVSTLKRRLNG